MELLPTQCQNFYLHCCSEMIFLPIAKSLIYELFNLLSTKCLNSYLPRVLAFIKTLSKCWLPLVWSLVYP
ncbi:unnamed protein product [Meloidogyne enterolobii]|uniref:Uncharacterized protein n=1 Tax=Meloidogyne enterolobii TaxID=390850 RepID=A0ACB0XP63_MELEN